MRWGTILIAWLACVAAKTDVQSIRVATAPERTGVTLLLGAPPAALVQETRPLALPPGTTTLVLSWQGTKLAADSLRLTVADESVGVTGPRLPADRPQEAEWTLTAAQVVETQLTVRYLTGGLTWEPEYTLVLGGAEQKASLGAMAVLRNDSGEDFEDAQVDLGLASPVSANLEQGAVLRLPFLSAPEVACELTHVFDAAAGPDTAVQLRLRNVAEAGLGSVLLPSGKMRLYEDRAGRRLLVGEVRLPSTPVGAKAELVLGTAREVSVERRVLRVADQDVRKDVHGRLALYDREEEIAFVVESAKNDDVLLKIVETIDGEWTMLSNSHEFERKDASHLEFLVPVAAHSELTVKYKVRRLNLLP
ncbi:MAG: DUF4139 domain-containing protein [Armatimonadetes bacterium]|nr:DUF4139 domain-containing protein [Armatimonadota bacterium]